jgi:uncharacterized protein (DUF697 family)/tellurite resistance protein
MNQQEQKAIIGICILAAVADGAQSQEERTRVQQAVEGFPAGDLDLAALYQDVLAGRLPLESLATSLSSPEGRTLAYEMAVGVCHADGALTPPEEEFLAGLRQRLGLEAAGAQTVCNAADALVSEPLPGVAGTAPPAAEIDRLILNSAILNGALELMPQTLATLAIVPLQMRLVYRIGQAHGYTLGRGHVRDFVATVGIGLTSQVVEGYASRLLGGLTRRFAGRLLGGLAAQATGSAFAFATTYALGQVARQYYASGRTLTAAQLKTIFTGLLGDGRTLQDQYAGEIAAKARQTNVADLLPLVRES